MSDQESAEATATEADATTEQQETEQQKPTETVEFWKQKAREQEKRAKDNAGAAKRLAEIEEAQKSEADKAAERIRSLEGEVENAQRDALRFKVASQYGISDDDTELFLTGSDEDTLAKQAERLGQRSDERKKQGNHAPREGATTRQPGPDEEREAVRELFGPG